MNQPRTTLLSAQSARRCNMACHHGIVLFSTLVALLAAVVITMGILRAAMSQYAQIREHRRQLQAEQLTQAAFSRATNRLQAANDYRGETWHVSADEVGGPDPAEVVIEVRPDDANTSNKLRIAVQTDYPQDDIYRIRQSRQLLVTLKPRGESP